jgi:hypothetical protein
MKTQVKRKLNWVVAQPPKVSPFCVLEAEFKKRGWECWNWENGMMKNLPFSTENYDYEEYDPSKVTIPQRGLQRLDVALGMVEVRRVIIADEKDPVIELEPLPDWKPEVGKIKPPEVDSDTVIKVGKVFGILVIGVAALLALPLLILGGTAAAAILYDPSVIVELEDGTWAEVYYWFPQDSSEH